MNIKKNKLYFKWLINLLLGIICLVLTYYIIEERILLSRYIRKIESAQKIHEPYSDADILSLQSYVYHDIDFKYPRAGNSRPQVGWTVREILKRKQGLCGEGSRLLYHILRNKGIESRRVYLHGNTRLHVIIEYKNNEGKWVLLETLNGPDSSFKAKLDENKFTIDSLFNSGPYRYHITPKPFAEKYGYNNYSYLPFNGMFNNKIFKTEIYIHHPANRLVNFLLETHELSLLLISLLILAVINLKQLRLYFALLVRPKFTP